MDSRLATMPTTLIRASSPVFHRLKREKKKKHKREAREFRRVFYHITGTNRSFVWDLLLVEAYCIYPSAR